MGRYWLGDLTKQLLKHIAVSNVTTRLTDSRNTAIYRELMERERVGATRWDQTYGADAISTEVQPSMDEMSA